MTNQPSPDMEITEEELKLAGAVFQREWAKLYDVPPHHPGLPLAHAITAVLERRAASASPDMGQSVSDDVETFTPDEAWSHLCEMDDRTSPEDYPDHCLITKDELARYMRAATAAERLRAPVGGDVDKALDGWTIERLIDELGDPHGSDWTSDAKIMKRASNVLAAMARVRCAIPVGGCSDDELREAWCIETDDDTCPLSILKVLRRISGGCAIPDGWRVVPEKAIADYDMAMEALGSCGDGNCVILKPKGQHTNGGCNCYRDEKRARRAMACASFLRSRISAAPALPIAKGK